jgi:hypothetical protein
MLKLYRNVLMGSVLALGLAACGDDLTITDPGPGTGNPNIVSFSVNPTNAVLAAGTFVQAGANLVTATGVTGTVAWSTSNAAVADVDATGKITAVSNGTAVITATATAGGQTATAQIGVTVRNIQAAQISIQSVTQGGTNMPVNISNVGGQIEITLNFDPGEQSVDSVAVFVGNKRAAMQSFATSPAAGEITLSVNTANYVKNSTTGVATVDFLNGPTTISAAVYPTGGSATATNTIQIVLNNMDGWAADMVTPTQTANSVAGLTYWGGPTAAGQTMVTVYPVIYTPGRTVTSVTFRVGRIGFVGCPNYTDTSLPFRSPFGYTTGVGEAPNCGGAGGYEWTGGPRDNVIIVAATDNVNTQFPALAPLIPNTVVLGSTPDSVRFDWASPAVNTPSIARTAPAVTGWVNGPFNFVNFASADAGVGLRATRDRSGVWSSVNCPGVVAVDVPMATGTGADINGGVACPTNFIGGAVGLGNPGTAPWMVRGTESDRLNNMGQSALTSTFGTDYTASSIRWGLVSAAPVLPAAVSADTIFRAAKPTTQEWRVEYLDERSGFYNAGQPDGFGVAAQTHSMSAAGHVLNTGACVAQPFTSPFTAITAGSPGAAFVTAQTCPMQSITTGGPLRLDGWQAGQSVIVPANEDYYGYRSAVTDAAGNTSATLFRKAVVNTMSPFSTGLGVPATIDETSFSILATMADSVEIVAQSLRVDYPNLPTVVEARYPRVAVGTVFDDVITSPFVANIAPATGAPYAKRIEIVDGTAFPGNNVMAVGAPTNVKPTAVQAWSWNPGSINTGGPTPGVSSLIAIPGLLVENGDDIASFNTANPTIAVNHWRIISTVATTNQFNSTVPLRAQVVAPTNSPNAPFTRVDFYRQVAATYWAYLGSVAGTAAVPSDQGTYRSWVYALSAPYAVRWDGTAQTTAVVAGDIIIAVGVTPAGNGISTLSTTMVP